MNGNLLQVEPQIKQSERQRPGQDERCSRSVFSISFCCHSNCVHEAQVCPLVFTVFPRGLQFKYKRPPSPTLQSPVDNSPSAQYAWSYDFVPMNYVIPLSWWVSGLIWSHSIHVQNLSHLMQNVARGKRCFYMSHGTLTRVKQRMTNSYIWFVEFVWFNISSCF